MVTSQTAVFGEWAFERPDLALGPQGLPRDQLGFLRESPQGTAQGIPDPPALPGAWGQSAGASQEAGGR